MQKNDPTAEKGTTDDPAALGRRVRGLRQTAGMSQRRLAETAGISFSAISKIENNLLSPTYDSLIRLSRGLGCDITDLFRDPSPRVPTGRRSITRSGEGVGYPTADYDYELLCNDLAYKKMTPIRAIIKAGSMEKISALSSHEGEELIYVLSGTVEVHTQFYQPAVLNVGDCIYFDSSMEHACINKGDTDAEIFWVSSSPSVEETIKK